jgi:ribosome-associated protein
MKRDESLIIKEIIMKSLDDGKAEDVEVVDLQGKAEFAKLAIIATGRANRHVAALADNIADALKESNLLPGGIRMEGMETKQWVLVDAGEVIVHIFLPETRELYDLGKLYANFGKANAVH